MAKAYIGSTQIKQIYIGGTKVKKAYLGSTPVFSAGNTVTYYVDSSEAYTEEVDYGESYLSPSTFTPSKSGWTFVGWRTDTTASSSVLTTGTMGDDPVTLYAVFSYAVTLTYSANGGSSTPSTQTGYKYYNCGNTSSDPSFTLAAAISRSTYTFKGWTVNSTVYSAGATVTLSASATATAYWSVQYAGYTDTAVLYSNWVNDTNTVSLEKNVQKAVEFKGYTTAPTYGGLSRVAGTNNTSYYNLYTSKDISSLALTIKLRHRIAGAEEDDHTVYRVYIKVNGTTKFTSSTIDHVAEYDGDETLETTWSTTLSSVAASSTITVWAMMTDGNAEGYIDQATLTANGVIAT